MLPLLAKRRDFTYCNFTVSGYYRDKYTGLKIIRLDNGHRVSITAFAHLLIRKEPKSHRIFPRKY